MKNCCRPNLDGKGRFARALYGLVLVAVGFAFCRAGHKWLGVLVMLAGGFGWFEAARGWCLVRACGFKTKLYP